MARAGEAPRTALEVTAPMTKQAGLDSDRSAQRAADSDVSLGERAAIAARAELRGERTGILGAIGEAPLGPLTRLRRVPESWRRAANCRIAGTRTPRRRCATSAKSSTNTPPRSRLFSRR